MDSNFIFELQALIQKMNQSEAIKSMDPVVRYALYMQLMHADVKLIKDLSEIMVSEEEEHIQIEKKYSKAVEKIIQNYKFKVDHAEYDLKKKKAQKATRKDQKMAEKILKSII